MLGRGVGLSTHSDSELITQALCLNPPEGETNGPDWPARINHLMRSVKITRIISDHLKSSLTIFIAGSILTCPSKNWKFFFPLLEPHIFRTYRQIWLILPVTLSSTIRQQISCWSDQRSIERQIAQVDENSSNKKHLSNCCFQIGTSQLFAGDHAEGQDIRGPRPLRQPTALSRQDSPHGILMWVTYRVKGCCVSTETETGGDERRCISTERVDIPAKIRSSTPRSAPQYDVTTVLHESFGQLLSSQIYDANDAVQSHTYSCP